MVADFTFSIFVVGIGFSVVIDGRISLICQIGFCWWKISLKRGVHSLEVIVKCLSKRPEYRNVLTRTCGVSDGFNDYQLVGLNHHNVLLIIAFSKPSQIGTDNANR